MIYEHVSRLVKSRQLNSQITTLTKLLAKRNSPHQKQRKFHRHRKTVTLYETICKSKFRCN